MGVNWWAVTGIVAAYWVVTVLVRQIRASVPSLCRSEGQGGECQIDASDSPVRFPAGESSWEN